MYDLGILGQPLAATWLVCVLPDLAERLRPTALSERFGPLGEGRSVVVFAQASLPEKEKQAPVVSPLLQSASGLRTEAQCLGQWRSGFV